MNVILLQKVDGLGNLGDAVSVKAGYGRNYLIPTGRAVPATVENVKAFEARREELEAQESETRALAEARKARLEGLASITIAWKAGEGGRLFGSIGTADIARAVQESGLELEKHEIRLPVGAFRAVGEYEVELHLHTDVDTLLKLEIVPEA